MKKNITSGAGSLSQLPFSKSFEYKILKKNKKTFSLNQNLLCGNPKNCLNERHRQHMFLLKNKKKNIHIYLHILTPVSDNIQ